MTAFWPGLIATYIAIIIAFTGLIIVVLKHEKEERRKKCMMNHPAASRARIEPSHSGPTKTISLRPDAIPPGTLVRELEERLQKLHSSEESSSRPHHLEGD